MKLIKWAQLQGMQVMFIDIIKYINHLKWSMAIYNHVCYYVQEIITLVQVSK